MRVIKKISNILTGWGKRLGILQVSNAEKKLADLRMQICTACPYTETKKILKILKGTADYEKVIACSKCKCPCWEKTIVVDEKCPIDKW